MNIFEIVKEKERRMATLYKELALECPNEYIKGVFRLLEEQETHHYQIIGEMEKNFKGQVDDNILQDVKVLFSKIKEQKARLLLSESQLKVYQEVQSLEKENELFYREKAKEVEASNKSLSAILEGFAKEEHRHYLLMSEIVDYVLRPDQWVENAEFNHLDEY